MSNASSSSGGMATPALSKQTEIYCLDSLSGTSLSSYCNGKWVAKVEHTDIPHTPLKSESVSHSMLAGKALLQAPPFKSIKHQASVDAKHQTTAPFLTEFY